MKIDTFANGPFMVNTYLVYDEDTGCSFIIDPGQDIKRLLHAVENNQLKVEAIVATHGHIDHVESVSILRDRYGVPFYLNELDRELIDSLSMQAAMFGVSDPGRLEFDVNLPASGSIDLAGFTLNLFHTPGHSRGSISIQVDDVIFSGDVLFNMSIGRTDLPGGNYSQLITSIKEKIFSLPENTRIMPGHGPDTTVSRERSMNPFILNEYT